MLRLTISNSWFTQAVQTRSATSSMLLKVVFWKVNSITWLRGWPGEHDTLGEVFVGSSGSRSPIPRDDWSGNTVYMARNRDVMALDDRNITARLVVDNWHRNCKNENTNNGIVRVESKVTSGFTSSSILPSSYCVPKTLSCGPSFVCLNASIVFSHGVHQQQYADDAQLPIFLPLRFSIVSSTVFFLSQTFTMSFQVPN